MRLPKLPSSPPEVCQWIDVPLRDIRSRLKSYDAELAGEKGGSFYFADDSLPDLKTTWAGSVGGWRCQPISRLHLMLEGEHQLTFSQNEQAHTVRVKPGDIWFFPADAHDYEVFATPCHYAAVIFHAAFTRFIIVKYETVEAASRGPKNALRRTWIFHWQEARPPAIATALESLTQALRDEPSGGIPSGAEAASHLARGVWILLKGWLQHKAAAPPPMGKAHASWLAIDRYLQENYHRPLNRKVASHALGLHPNRISALCAEFARQSFQRILEERRLKQAMRLLETSDHKIEAISALCGYASAAYFSRTFRRATGKTPGQWRLKHLKLPEQKIRRPRRQGQPPVKKQK